MDTIQCAVVLAKMERFEWEVQQRLEIGRRYNEMIDAMGVKRVIQRADRTSVFAQYTTLMDNREAVQAKLMKAGIPTAVHYPIPLNEQPAYRAGPSDSETPISRRFSRMVMSLPMSADMSFDQQRRIVNALIL